MKTSQGKSYMTKNNTQNESGRSMVEMLGVLAIIGILSIGGLSGYSRAMKKYRANELINEASRRAISVAEQFMYGNTADLGEFNNNTFKAAEFATDPITKDVNNQFELAFVTGKIPDEDTCEQMKDLTENGSIMKFADDCSKITLNADLKKFTSNDNSSSNNSSNNNNNGDENTELQNTLCPDNITSCPSNQVCCPQTFEGYIQNYLCKSATDCHTHSKAACEGNCTKECHPSCDGMAWVCGGAKCNSHPVDLSEGLENACVAESDGFSFTYNNQTYYCSRGQTVPEGGDPSLCEIGMHPSCCNVTTQKLSEFNGQTCECTQEGVDAQYCNEVCVATCDEGHCC